MYIREQSEILISSLDEIKAYIKLLTAKNKDLTEKNKELEDDSDKEVESINGTRFEFKQYGDKLHEKAPKLKCCECDFVGNSHMVLKKHGKKVFSFL